MDLLLDTHVVLWWDLGASALKPTARAALSDPTNRVLISAASVWEIAIKRAKGKLTFPGSPSEAIARAGFIALPMTALHAERAAGLDWQRSDPFDRMLVAQAQIDGLTLVHADEAIRRVKDVAQLWAR